MAASPECFPRISCTSSSQTSLHRLPRSASLSLTSSFYCCKASTLRGDRLIQLPSSIGRKGNATLSRVIASDSAASAGIHTPLYDPVYRAKIAEEYGFTHIGEPLPSNVTLKNILDTFPPEVYKVNEWKAWRSVAISVAAYVAGLFLIAESPWYLLPLAWFWTGTALQGFFCIGYECGHKVYFSNKLVEDVVGTLVMLPIIFPFEPWRIKHDRHHAKTNMIGEDTAWHPIVREDYEGFSSFEKLIVRLLLGPLRPLASNSHCYSGFLLDFVHSLFQSVHDQRFCAFTG